MGKIAILGAGSITFGPTLLNDMLATEALAGSTYALMGPTLEKVQRVENYIRKLIDKNELDATIYSTTDRRDALKDADYVIPILDFCHHFRDIIGHILEVCRPE